LNIRGEIDNFSGFKCLDVIQVNRLAVVILPVESLVEARCPCGHADLLASLGFIRSRNFVFGEDGFKRTFGDAGPAVYAGVRVNVEPRPFVNRFSGDDAFNRAHVYTPRVA
jgi:hypothetical protein